MMNASFQDWPEIFMLHISDPWKVITWSKKSSSGLMEHYDIMTAAFGSCLKGR